VVAVIGVEATAEFLSKLDQFKKFLYLLTVISFAALLHITLFITRAILSLITAEEALGRAENFAGMGRMDAGIAHEIRNPLGIIKSTSDLLKKSIFYRSQAQN
jgi:signal transduction histidine kinase